ncbi:MAG: hypothetical protein ACRD0K_05925 [Egibacteraceae bacterium]
MGRRHRIAVDEQEPTRRLSVYEEQERTQRLQVPLAPPWDEAEPAPELAWAADNRQRHRGRGWPTALVVSFTLLGVVLGVLGTLVVTGATRGQVDALEAQLAQARQAAAERDARISELEEQLEDARSNPAPQVQLPPGFDLPGFPFLPDNGQGRELLEQLQRRIRDLIERQDDPA